MGEKIYYIIENLPNFLYSFIELYIYVLLFYMFFGFMFFVATILYLHILYIWIRYKEKFILLENREEEFFIFEEYEGEALTGEKVKGRLIESIRVSISDEKGNIHEVFPNTVRIIRARNLIEIIKCLKDFFTYKRF